MILYYKKKTHINLWECKYTTSIRKSYKEQYEKYLYNKRMILIIASTEAMMCYLEVNTYVCGSEERNGRQACTFAATFGKQACLGPKQSDVVLKK